MNNKKKLKELGLWDNWFFRLSQNLVFWFFGIIIKYWCGLSYQGIEKVRVLDQCIFAPTHSSHLDFWAVLQDIPKPLRQKTYIGAARDYFYQNFITRTITKLGSYHNFPFDRQLLTPSGYRQLVKIMQAGLSLLMFPQGTRSRDGALKPFKPLLAMLAVENQVPIIPVLVKGTFEALPAGKLLIKKKPITVIFGDPIFPDKINHGNSRKQLLKEARKLNKKVMESIESMLPE